MIPTVVDEKSSKTWYFRDISGIPQPRFFDKSKSLLAGKAKTGLHHRVERKSYASSVVLVALLSILVEES